jgi:isopropylmalate/homocitrate/citramalate synthase
VRVTICEVGPRDGLQNEEVVLAPDVRAELIDRLTACGFPRIEACSFVSPARVPQMAGAEEVAAAIRRRRDVTYAGLALNERGYERLAVAGLDAVHFALAATEEFNRRNQNASVEESANAARRIVKRAHDDGRRATVTISVAFGCPFEGPVDPGRVLAVAEEAVAAGADEICFADTIGVGVPSQARLLVEGARALGVRVGVHLHDTRSTAISCAFAALEAGATVFDASVGGLGGCPFAPRATGNVATEDLLYLLEREGVTTGVNLDGVIGVAEWLGGQLDKRLPGHVLRAGNWPPTTG